MHVGTTQVFFSPDTIADLGITDLVVPEDDECPFDFPCPGNPSQSCGCVFENGAVHPVVADVKDMGKLYYGERNWVPQNGS